MLTRVAEWLLDVEGRLLDAVPAWVVGRIRLIGRLAEWVERRRGR